MLPCGGVAFIREISFWDEIRQDVGILPGGLFSESKRSNVGSLQQMLKCPFKVNSLY